MDQRFDGSAARSGATRPWSVAVAARRLRKYLGAYFAVLNGAHAVIFTAGIGENAPAVRVLACESLSGLGIAIDAAKNARRFGAEGYLVRFGPYARVGDPDAGRIDDRP